MIAHGKIKRMGMFSGKRPDWKKAVVTLRRRPNHRSIRTGVIMGIRKYKPTTATLRYKTGYTFEEITKTKPERGLIEHITRKAGKNNQGRVTLRYRGGGHKRLYRQDRLQAGEARHPGQGGQHRVRSQQVGADRPACITPTARSATSSGRSGSAVGHTVQSGPGSEIRPGNAMPLEGDTAGDRGPQRRDGAGQGRAAGAQRGLVRPMLVAKEGDVRPPEAALGRDEAGAAGLPGDHRAGGQRRARAA